MLVGLDRLRAGASLLVVLLALVAVVGEAAEAKATIPFSFSVNDATLPLGTYAISSDPLKPGAIVVRGTTRVVIAITSPRYSSGDYSARLVFHRYGNDYFLRQVWTYGGRGHELRETQGERVRREGGKGKVAVQPERIVVPVL
jgi:hypothetical protein